MDRVIKITETDCKEKLMKCIEQQRDFVIILPEGKYIEDKYFKTYPAIEPEKLPLYHTYGVNQWWILYETYKKSILKRENTTAEILDLILSCRKVNQIRIERDEGNLKIFVKL